MLAHVAKWGNSLGVRIPRAIATQIGISAGIPIQITIENNHIIIQKRTYSLDSLLAEVTPENIHHEVDSGAAVGKEIW